MFLNLNAIHFYSTLSGLFMESELYSNEMKETWYILLLMKK